jgi:hypothetical protein
MASTPVSRQSGPLLRVGAGRRLAAGIADKTDFALAGNAGLVRHFGDPRGLLDVLVERLARTVEHQRGETAVERLAAFLEGVAVIEMGDDRNGRVFGEMRNILPSIGSGVCARQDGPACRITGRPSASPAAT